MAEWFEVPVRRRAKWKTGDRVIGPGGIPYTVIGKVPGARIWDLVSDRVALGTCRDLYRMAVRLSHYELSPGDGEIPFALRMWLRRTGAIG